LISVAALVVTSIDPRWVTSGFFPLLVLEPVAFLSLLLLTHMNHTRTRRSSTITLLFWPPYFAALLIWSRTTLGVARSPLSPVFALRWTIGALALVAFALECLGPEYCSEPDSTPRLNPESPLLTANTFSVWTFSWLTPLMERGAKQFITEDDLPELVPEDEASKLGQSLQRSMKKQ
jgi:ATP-binding cassette subfamily C (CFTR/MRP) protein 1